MALDVEIENESGVRIPISARRIGEIVRAVCRSEGVGDGEISVTFVTDRRIASLNRRYIGHRGATDVVTFQLGAGGRVVGDVYIAPGVARRNARAHAVRVRDELVRLIVHGTLHALGYTHDDGPGRTTGAMWSRQEELVARLS